MRLIIEDVKHLKLKQDLLWIGTATLVTVVIWISYSVYSAFNTSKTDPEVEKLLKPFNPNLDTEILNSLETRFVPPENFTISTVTPTPVSTSSPSLR